LLLPGIDATGQGQDVGETFVLILVRPTGGCPLARSGAVKDDLLVPGKGSLTGTQLIQRERTFQVILMELRVIVVGANQEGRARLEMLVRRSRIDSIGHDIILRLHQPDA
jgi:hypothetical protein